MTISAADFDQYDKRSLVFGSGTFRKTPEKLTKPASINDKCVFFTEMVCQYLVLEHQFTSSKSAEGNAKRDVSKATR
jgi:hypothetical protein